jgi:EAL domain-containing protein (putative c-di-GMP-specific phosphodiesterase class I)
MDRVETALAALSKLKVLGVQLAIDDFGKGYSSLSYLHQFPCDMLKIDQSFIERIGTGGENSEIVRTILGLARGLGLDVVAEGIETPGQLACLRELGCGYGQGYLLSRPLTVENATALLADPPRWFETETRVTVLSPPAPHLRHAGNGVLMNVGHALSGVQR